MVPHCRRQNLSRTVDIFVKQLQLLKINLTESRVLVGRYIQSVDIPSRDPCASLFEVSLTGFRDRGIRLEVIRQIGTVEM